MGFWNFVAGTRNAAIAFALLVSTSQASYADSNVLVLLCKGTQYCASCGEGQKQVDFDWTYTIDFSSGTVDDHPATITDERIAWELKGNGLLDQREISRYSKKFHFEAKAPDGGPIIYYGDGACEPQQQKAF